ncbi:DUF3307 domain-containing protein [Metabacillus litoralis]|uniref:DUF3307 domain-containing protein n=1 Tax=Metabacillus litoralis TaxID=152268 RepID=UPI001CFCA737|nr:DUF3307 domain-containing protein [Metabacillus litoralis]
MIKLFLIFILAHFMCDFITQTNYTIKKKELYFKRKFFRRINIGLTEHVGQHMVVTLLLTFLITGVDFYLTLPVLLIGVIHYFVDFLKVKYSEKLIEKMESVKPEKKGFHKYLLERSSFHFILDQAIHILTIYLVLLIFGKVYSPTIMFSKFNDFIYNNLIVSDLNRIIVILALIILLTYGSGYFIGEVLKDIKRLNSKKVLSMEEEAAATIEKNELDGILVEIEQMKKNVVLERSWEISDEKNSKKSIKIQLNSFNEIDDNAVGKYIGILERFLIAVFIILQAYPGLVVLGAFKTLTRFKQLEDKSFAENYLIGTLLSIVLGILFGGLIYFMLNDSLFIK